MAEDIRGHLKLTAGGKEYTLFVGFSVLAELQARHGQDVLSKLDPPAGAGDDWTPDLAIVTDLFEGALQRYHADEADRWLVDDIISENMMALPRLIAASFPPQEPTKTAKPGNGKRPKAAASK